MASSGPDSGKATNRREFRNLVLTLHLPAIAMGLGLGITVPVLPELTKELGVGVEAAVLVFAFQLLGTFAAPMPTGWLIDRLGRRRVLLAGPVITAVASLLMAKVAIDGSFVELLVYRFIGGWGEQMWMLSRITVIADTGSSGQRGKQITSMFGVQQFGTLAGPAIGGVAADQLGLWTPFVMHAVVAMAALIPSFYLLKESAPARGASSTSGGAGHWSRLRFAPIPAVFAVQFLANIPRGGVFGGGVIVLYAAFAYDVPPTELGFLRSSMAAVGIPITFAAGYIMDRFGRKYTIVPGLLLTATSMLFLAATAYLDLSYMWFVAAFVYVHMAVNVISGNMQTLATDVAPEDARGMFFGVSRTIAQGGSFLSPTSWGVLLALGGAPVAFVFLGTSAFFAAGIMFFLVPETLRKRVHASDE